MSEQNQMQLVGKEIKVVEPTREEVKFEIEKLKNNKSPGKNGITHKNIKYEGKNLKLKLYELIMKIWRQEMIPRSWEQAITIPIFQNSGATDCHNYRGISLLVVTHEVLATILKIRLEEIINAQLRDYQSGYREGTLTTY